jgi:protoheme IX farnesyltransferase
MSVQSEVGQVDLTGEPSVSDFIQLMKPRVMQLVILTALAAMLAAPGPLNPIIGCIAMIAIAVGAGASGALNMWYDADIDAHMARTAARPLPRGRVSPGEALGFGAILSIGSVLTLGVLVNWAAGALLALTIAFYVFIYTMWLKRRTPQNIVIGGAAGAFAPMIGWAAVTGSLTFEPLILFILLFFWSPSLYSPRAIYMKEAAARAGVPMLPVVAGPQETRKQILIYSVLLVPLGVVPYFIGLGGVAYLISSVALGLGFLGLAVKVYFTTEGREADTAARQLFWFSILYLYVLFTVLLVEASIGRILV